jgi:hypothetical protein
MTLNLTQKELEAWERFIYETTPAVKQAAQNGQPVVINIFVDNSINIQSVMTSGQIPVHMTDGRNRLTKYLPSNYHHGNMDALAAKIADNPNYAYTPLTKEERAAMGGGYGY